MSLSDLRGKLLDAKYSLLDKWDDLKANPHKMIVVAAAVFFVVGLGLGYMNR